MKFRKLIPYTKVVNRIEHFLHLHLENLLLRSDYVTQISCSECKPHKYLIYPTKSKSEWTRLLFILFRMETNVSKLSADSESFFFLKITNLRTRKILSQTLDSLGWKMRWLCITCVHKGRFFVKKTKPVKGSISTAIHVQYNSCWCSNAVAFNPNEKAENYFLLGNCMRIVFKFENCSIWWKVWIPRCIKDHFFEH